MLDVFGKCSAHGKISESDDGEGEGLDVEEGNHHRKSTAVQWLTCSHNWALFWG